MARIQQEIDINNNRVQRLENYENFDESEKLVRPDAITDYSGSLFIVPAKNRE